MMLIKLQLRHYQERLVQAVFEKWREVISTLLVAATGTGKTVIFAEVIRRSMPGRALVLAHRTELIDQAREKIESLGIPCEIEKADLFAATNLFHATPVVVSSIQTQCSGPKERRRYTRFSPKDFSTLICDECFPAGTLVSGTPIEALILGDSIATHRGSGTVERLFRREAPNLVQITLSDGKTLTCTGNHPIWSNGQFTCASDLEVGDPVLTITDHELPSLQYRNTETQAHLRFSKVQKREQPTNDPSLFQKARGRDNKIPENERDARSSHERKSFQASERDRVGTKDSRRQRPRPDSSRAVICESNRMASPCEYPHERTEREWLPNCVQGRCWKPFIDDSGRGRWFLSFLPGKEAAGCKERRLAAFAWVASVQVFKRSDRKRFAKVCPDGFVYNLTVSNGNTYLANGILVHNCHHSASPTWREVIDYYRQNPNLKVLGVTATPDRADRAALGQVFETVAGTYDILDAIQDGYLVDITQQFCTVNSLDYSHIRTKAGDLHEGDLAKVMEEERNVHGICQPVLEVMHGLAPKTLNDYPVPDWRGYLQNVQIAVKPRRTIVFTVSVLQAEIYCDVLSRAMDGVEWVCGKTRKEDRAAILARFAKGETHCVVNCGVLTEGFDNPGVEVIVMARPTKSRSLYAQMVGRSTRPLPGLVDGDLVDTAEKRKEAIRTSAKPFCRILDFVGNSGRHKLVTCMDVLGGKVSPDAVAAAVKKAQREGKPVNVLRAMSNAEVELEKQKAAEADRRRRQEKARKAHLLARSQYSLRDVNPFDQMDAMATNGETIRRGKKTYTAKQREFLRRWCGRDPDKIPYGYGTKLIAAKLREWDQRKGKQ